MKGSTVSLNFKSSHMLCFSTDVRAEVELSEDLRLRYSISAAVVLN